MQLQGILVALKLCFLLVLLTATRAWPLAGLPPTASAAEVETSVLAETLASPSANGASAGATPTPVAEMYLEGTIEAEYFYGCPVLETASDEYFLLAGDLQGFGIGDQVGVWANFCLDCVSICTATGGIVTVKGIIGLDAVGGIAELPEAAGTPLQAGGSSGRGAGVLVGIAASAAAGAVALGGAAWWLGRRKAS